MKGLPFQISYYMEVRDELQQTVVAVSNRADRRLGKENSEVWQIAHFL